MREHYIGNDYFLYPTRHSFFTILYIGVTLPRTPNIKLPSTVSPRPPEPRVHPLPFFTSGASNFLGQTSVCRRKSLSLLNTHWHNHLCQYSPRCDARSRDFHNLEQCHSFQSLIATSKYFLALNELPELTCGDDRS